MVSIRESVKYEEALIDKLYVIYSLIDDASTLTDDYCHQLLSSEYLDKLDFSLKRPILLVQTLLCDL